MERNVHPGEFYRHFKDKLYQIITVAIHSETGEPMVVYQALYGDFKTYVRPLAMFLEAVDRSKYPDAGQTWRFERVELTGSAAPVTAAAPSAPGTATASSTVASPEPVQTVEEPQVNPMLIRFLDARTPAEKLDCLDLLEKSATQKDLDSIYVVLDIRPVNGTVAEQLDAVRRYLNMQKHYDGGHLR